MDKQKIEIIYKMLISGTQLNDITLRVYGISKEDVTTLLENKVIELTKDNTYKLVLVENFRQYGINLLLNKRAKEANICFKLCYQMAPHDKNICLQALLAAIVRADFKNAFEIFSDLEKIEPENNLADNNLYLYLLSVISIVPKKYREASRNLTFTDLELPSSKTTELENEVRKLLTEGKFSYAYYLIHSQLIKKGEYSVKHELIRSLTIEAIKADKGNKAKILNLITNENYEELVSVLTAKKEQRQLSKIETSVLHLSNAIINISKNEVIPEPADINTNNMFEAISNNDFELALRLNEEFLEFTNANKLENLIYILLIKLNNLILEIKENKLIAKKEQELTEKTPELTLESLDLTEIEEFAYYISSQYMSLDTAKRKLGILHHQTLLIKLIYVRDYYIESNYDIGDKLLKEVEQDRNKSEIVLYLLKEIKTNRDNYKNEINLYTKKKTK